MSLVPVIISYQGGRKATEQDELAAREIAKAAMLSYERVIGRHTSIEPVAVIEHDQVIWIPEGGTVSGNTGIWAQVAMTLAEHYDLSAHEHTFAVWVLHNPSDASGVGQPLFDEAKGWVLWNEEADPDLSGLCVMGERALLRLKGVSHARGYYSSRDRIQMDFSRWLAIHELGHAWGRHHTGRDSSHSNGQPGNEEFKQNSWMAYGSSYFVNGDMKSIGLYRDEITTFRLSKQFDKGEALSNGEFAIRAALSENEESTINRNNVRGVDYLRLYFPDRKAITSHNIPAKIVLGQGLLPGDYV